MTLSDFPARRQALGDGPVPDQAGLHWRCIPFLELGPIELAQIYRARQQVFVVEQQCAFLDADGRDEASHHLAAWAAGDAAPLAYARLLAPGSQYADAASIGRVLTSASARRCGLGRELTARALAGCHALWPLHPVRISAQARLQHFYAGFGFVAVGSPYLEDGILHVEMLRTGRGETGAG